MSKKEEKRKEKKRRLVNAALEILEKEGLKGVTMRRVAAGAGVSPMLIYSYIDGTVSLRDEMQAECLKRLCEALTTGGGAYAASYMDFAAKHPHIYTMAMRPKGLYSGDGGAILKILGADAWARLHGVAHFESAKNTRKG